MSPRLSTIRAGDGWANPGGFHRWRCLSVVCLFLLTSLSLSARQPTEYEVKAAFLLNFAKFVEWPPKAYPDAKGPLVIGIVGDDPFGDALPQIVKGQTAQGRPIEIRHFRPDEDYGNCHVLFVSRSLAEHTGDVLKRVQGRPVLTVGDQEDFAQRGGVIGFALVNKSVRFDINAKVAEALELKISSKLLAVARSVVKTS